MNIAISDDLRGKSDTLLAEYEALGRAYAQRKEVGADQKARLEADRKHQDDLLRLGKKIAAALVGGAEQPSPWEVEFSPQADAQSFCLPLELAATGKGVHLCRTGSLVRVIQGNNECRELTLPLRVLFIIAEPTGYVPLAGEHELDLVRQKLGAYRDQLISVDTVSGSNTVKQLVALSEEGRLYDLVVLIAHGEPTADASGVIWFVGPHDEAQPVNGGTLYGLLSTLGPPALVLLNTCWGSGGRVAADTLGSVAWCLLLNGIPAIVAMQRAVDTLLAADAGSQFLAALMSGAPLADCVTAMRKQLDDAWYAPVLAVQKGLAGRDCRLTTVEDAVFLRKLAQLNKEGAAFLAALKHSQGTPEAAEARHKDLFDWLSSVPAPFYRLLHNRDEFAKRLMDHAAEVLGLNLN